MCVMTLWLETSNAVSAIVEFGRFRVNASAAQILADGQGPLKARRNHARSIC